MRNIIFPVLICCLATGCGLFKQQAPFVREGHRVGGHYVEQVKSIYGYRAYGIGGAFPDRINGFLYDFFTYDDLSERMAEEHIKEMYQLLTDIVNQDERVRPYLSEWPFENRETCISIMFLDPIQGSFRAAPQLAMIGIKEGMLLKFYSNPKTGHLMNEKKYQKYLEEERLDSGS